MKTKIYELLKKWGPKILNWLKKQETKKDVNPKLKQAGKTTREIQELFQEIEKATSNDGIIDQDELQKILKEGNEAIIALYNLLFGKEIKIVLKKK